MPVDRAAALSSRREGDDLVLELAGPWSLATPVAGMAEARAAIAGLRAPATVRLRTHESFEDLDSRAAAALWSLLTQARARGLSVDDGALPADLRGVLALARPAAPAAPEDRRTGPGWKRGLGSLGEQATASMREARLSLAFVGEVLLALAALLRGRSRMRGPDLAFQIDQTGPRSLPIVALISFLVGLILAYMGADQLRRFGAQIYIADLVTIGVVREVAALMTAVILAGRVGAAFAAQLATMQLNEEIDALRALGLPPVEHLVLPRVIAITAVAPLLTAYAGGVGCLAGLVVAVSVFGLTPLEYIHQSVDALTPAHALVGLFKGTVYAMLVGLAGCRQGLHAGRSAQAVGEATTRAVVQSIVWVVVAASALTIVFQRLDV
jgi:phospholipid/cholesterol/gamma-HCH transport system permease protein